jgi:glycosyltransferase
MGTRRLSIILPSYNDSRIRRAIASIRRFDDIETVRIVVVDGGSSLEVKQIIRDGLSSEDIFISESDKGIFDAFNKGLDACDTEFIGWLGSDDLFTGKVLANQVVAALGKYDLFVANVAFFRDGVVTRITYSLPSRLGLVRYGFNNPHFATFGTARLLKSERFRLGTRAADIEYFVKIFDRHPRVASLNVVATLQEEGGFSNRSKADILRSNFELIPVFSRHTNWLVGPMAVALKLASKTISSVHCRLVRTRLTEVVQL